MPRKTRAALAAAAAAAEVAEVAEGKEEEEEEEEEAPEPSPPSSPLPSPSSGASDLLLAQFEHHQRKRAVAPGEADALASRLAERLEAHGLAGALGGMQIDGEEEEGGGGAAGLQAEVEGALMGLFDGAVAAAHLDAEGRKRKGGGGGGSKQENHENDDDDDDDEKEKDPEAGGGGGDPTEAVERVLDLAAALACRPGSPAGSRAPAALLGRALALAGCPSERVRALCCSFAGMCASRLGGREEEEEEGGGDDGDGPAAAAGDALDLAGQVLLPRLTDRSQSVRLAALGAAGPVLLARGCGGGAAEVAEAEAPRPMPSLLPSCCAWRTIPAPPAGRRQSGPAPSPRPRPLPSWSGSGTCATWSGPRRWGRWLEGQERQEQERREAPPSPPPPPPPASPPSPRTRGWTSCAPASRDGAPGPGQRPSGSFAGPG